MCVYARVREASQIESGCCYRLATGMQRSLPGLQHCTVTWAHSRRSQNVTPSSGSSRTVEKASSEEVRWGEAVTLGFSWKLTPQWRRIVGKPGENPGEHGDWVAFDLYGLKRESLGVCVFVRKRARAWDKVLTRPPCKWQVCQRCVTTRRDPHSWQHSDANNSLGVCVHVCVCAYVYMHQHLLHIAAF